MNLDPYEMVQRAPSLYGIDRTLWLSSYVIGRLRHSRRMHKVSAFIEIDQLLLRSGYGGIRSTREAGRCFGTRETTAQ